MKLEADVIIVGAGLSGLIAAREVLRAGKQALILEANDRVGGRILSEEIMPGVTIELGAQWIGDTHHRMFELAAELGVDTYPQFEDGETTYEIPGGPVMREQEFHQLHAAELEGLDTLLQNLDAMAVEIPLEAPWTAPQAELWDSMTADQWIGQQGLGPVARTLFEICCIGILAVPTCEVSLLDMIYNVQTCGVGSELFAESEGGAQTTRFVGGSSRIPEGVADQVGRDNIILNSPVQLIEYGNDSVTVTCRGGVVATGKQVIVALAPTLAGRIMYDPPLPGKRDQLTQRMPQASAVKVFAVYDEPFWRADGLNGQLISDLGPARMSNDSCIEAGGPGMILAFLEGDQARTFGRAPQEELHRLVTEELGRHFGPKALKPEMVVSGEWANREWTRGCYNANMGPQVWTRFGSTLSEPIGPIKWAATETSQSWNAYMEGAVEAGDRAARECLEALG